MIELRAMTSSDIPEGLRLCRASGWNQLEEDWRQFLDIPEGGGFLALKEGTAAAGTVTWRRYGAFSWLSMMLVDPAERKAGIGTQLFQAALDALADEPCVRLDAAPLGEPIYRKHGFVPEYQVIRTRVTVAVGQFQPSGGVRPITESDLDAILARDREVFGADRSSLLRSFYERAPELAWMTQSAYCFGRPGYRYLEVGPIVAGNTDAARELLGHCVAGQYGRTIVVDAPLEFAETLTKSGFEIERPFLRMRRGENTSPGMPEQQFGIAGPEFG